MFRDTLNYYHAIIKFTGEYFREKINVLDVTVMTHIILFMLVRVTSLIVKNQYLSVKLCVLTEFVPKTSVLINDVMN